MSDNNQDKPQLFNRFQAFGATLRQSAQEVASKALTQVNEIQQTIQQPPILPPNNNNADQQQQGVAKNYTQPESNRIDTTTATSSSTTVSISTTPDVIAQAAPSAATAATTTTLEKKDLLELLSKMNSKVKSLTSIRQQLMEEVQTLQQEKEQLSTFLQNEVFMNDTPTTDTNNNNNNQQQQQQLQLVHQLQKAWRQQEEQHQLSIQLLQKEFHKIQEELQNEKEMNRQLQQQKDATRNGEQQQQQQQASTDTIEAAATSTTEAAAAAATTAASELQAFKEKVAIARKMEIQKVKTETATMAKKIMETKLQEQKNVYEQQILSLQQQLEQVQQQQQQVTTAVTDSGSNVVETTEKLSMLEKEMEEMRHRHLQQLEEMTVQHQQQMKTIQLQLETTKQELNSMRQQQQNSNDTAAIQQQQQAMKQKEIEEEYKRNMDEMKRALQEKETQLSKVQSEISVKLEEQQKTMMEQFVQEKEQMRSDFQTKWKEATLANQTSAAQQLQNTIDTLNKESNDKITALQKEYDERHTNEILQIRSETEKLVQEAIEQTTVRAKGEMEQIRTTMEMNTKSLQDTITEVTKKYESATNQLQVVQSEYEKIKLALDTTQRQLVTSKEEVSSLLAEQTTKEELHVLQSEHEKVKLALATAEREVAKLNEALTLAEQNVVAVGTNVTDKNTDITLPLRTEIEEMKKDMDQMAQSRDEALFQIIDLQNEIKRINDANVVEFQTLQQKYDLLMQEYTTATETSQSNHTKSIEDTKTEITKLQTEIQELKDRNAVKVQEMQQQYDALNNEYKTTIETMQSNHTTSVDDSKKEITQLLSENKELLAKLSSMEDKHTNDVKKLQNDHEAMITKVREEKDIDMVSKASFIEMEQRSKDLQQQIETMQKGFEDEKVSMRKAMESHIDTLTNQFKDKLESARQKSIEEIATLQKSIQEKDGKLQQLLEKLKSLTTTSTKIRDENVAMKNKLEAEMNTQKELRGQLNAMKKQLDDTVANSSATASSLLKQQETLEKDKASLEHQIKTLRTELQSKSNKVEELNGKLHALSENLNFITQGQKEMEEKIERGSKQEAKLQASEMEVNDLREQINKLKLEMTKYVTTIDKLQAEKESNERNQGQRTAIVSMLETQVAEMSDKYSDVSAKLEAALYDLNQKSDTIQSDADRLKTLEQELEEARAESKRTAESLASAQKSNDAKANKMIETLQKELQSVKQQQVRKSAAAQQLLQQREAECAELRKQNKALQHEVNVGSSSDRRIFELAAKQSSRESYQVSEIEVRDSIIDRLKAALLERDGDLASAEKHAHEVECQIEELFRIRRREDVNIDYLKSIVVQYLSFPPGSTERSGLLPVLATLLQFDDADYRTIEEGKNKVSWWGTSVVPKLINAPSTNATVNGNASMQGAGGSVSAEVSISSNVPTPPTKRTSLQF